MIRGKITNNVCFLLNIIELFNVILVYLRIDSIFEELKKLLT